MIINVDLRSRKTTKDIHKQLKYAFGFFDGYGENWSALWDCLYCLYDEPTHVEIEGIQHLKENRMAESAEMLLEILERVRAQGDPLYTTVIS